MKLNTHWTCKPIATILALLLLLGGLFAGNAFLEGALDAITRGDATDLQQRYAYSMRTEIHNLGYAKGITDEQFQAFQKFYDAKTDELSRGAVEKSGLKMENQTPTKPEGAPKNIFTDTDNQLVGKNVVWEDVDKCYKNFNEAATEYIRGGKTPGAIPMDVPDGIDWAKNNKVDFFPTTESTTPETGVEIRKNINQRGGVAYVSNSAIDMEVEIRKAAKEGRTPKINAEGAANYNAEMDSQISHRLERISQNDAAMNALKTAGAGADDAMLTKLKFDTLEQQTGIAKYLVRKDDMNAALAKVNNNVEYKSPLDPNVRVAATRAPGTADAAEWVGRNVEDLTAKTNAGFAEITRPTTSNLANATTQERAPPSTQETPKTPESLSTRDYLSRQAESAKDWLGGKASAAYEFVANSSLGQRTSQMIGRIAETPVGRLGVGGYQLTSYIANGLENSLSRIGLKGIEGGKVGKAVGAGGQVLVGLEYLDALWKGYDTGDWKGALKDAAFTTGKNVVIGLVLAPVAAAFPVTATIVGGALVLYSGYHEVDSRSRSMADSIYISSQYDKDMESTVGKALTDMLKKGYKLPPGMSVLEARNKIDANLANHRHMFEGVFDKSRKGDPLPSNSGGAKPPSSGNSAIATQQAPSGTTVQGTQPSSVLTGTASGKTEVIDSEIVNSVQGNLNATDKSSINAGIEARSSGIFGSKINSESNIDVNASGKSSVNTGVQANNSTIKDSSITSVVKGGKVDASDGSNVNLGVKAGNSNISNSTITNTVTGGTVNVKKGATVNQGVKFEEDK